MDENKKPGQDNPDDFNFDNFFDSFENFEPFEAFEAEKKADTPEPEATVETPQGEDLNFIDSAKHDIDDISHLTPSPKKIRLLRSKFPQAFSRVSTST